MNIHIHIHKHSVDEKQIINKLNQLTMANERIEAALATIQEKQAQSATSIEGVASDVTYLKSNLPATGGMTQEEVDALAVKLEDVATKATATADALKALDDSTDSTTVDSPEGGEVTE